MPKTIDITGQTFGELTVIKRGPDRPHKSRRHPSAVDIMYYVRCSCGTTKLVRGSNLTYGRTRSCGHLRLSRAPITNAADRPYHMTPLYIVWNNTKNNCTNPNAPGYDGCGAKGIRMCAAWADSFETFAAAVGEKSNPEAVLERFDKSKDYEPGNVFWGTLQSTSRNRDGNHNVTWQGRTMCCAAWAELLHITTPTFLKRLASHGASVKTFRQGAIPRSVSHAHRLRLLTVNGVTKPLRAWATELKVPESTVRARRARGYSDAAALGLEPYVSPEVLALAVERVKDAGARVAALNVA